MEFSTSSMHDLLKENGDKRVSENAADKLGEILERFAGDVAEEARAVAKEEGYQTVKADHIREALM